MIGHLLNRRLVVWRPDTVSDGAGGSTVTYTEGDTIRAKVDEATVEERSTGQAWAAEHSHTVYLLTGTDVRRGDELRGDGQTFRVLATVTPSHPAYLKAPASEMTQHEGDPHG